MDNVHDLHLISFDLCPYVERSRIVLYEKDLSFEMTNIDLQDKPDWFLEISPRGKVPVLVVDEEPVFESNVINELLEELYPEPSMFPADPVTRAKARAWIVFNNDVLMSYAARLWFADDPDNQDEAISDLREAFRKVENLLEERDGRYLLSDKFGLVDAVYAPLFTRWEATQKLGYNGLMNGFERLRDYKEAVLSRDSVNAAKADDLTEKMLDYDK